MAHQTPGSDRPSHASSSDNVVFLDSTSKPAANTHGATDTSTVSPAADPFVTDGGVTVKAGGLPLTAWQSNAAELAKLLVGKQLGSYLIEESLGTGGMSAVFRAVDPQLDRRVALKVLPPILAAQSDHVQRFEREAKMAAQLDDEHVARVHQYGQDQGLHFIAYEYVEGTNLRDVLQQRGGRLPIADAIDYMTQAAEGLVHTAERGIIHRDIKPSNLVITATGKLKLVDLGLARNSLVEDSAALTQDGATLGTFDYLSPEQAIDPRLADVRSDIYSLGCTFYHALTGMPPVPEGTAARKLHSHQMELPRDPRELNAEISPALFGILCKMLAKRPEDRYQSPVDLKNDLECLSGNNPTVARIYPAAKETKSTSGTPWYVTIAALLVMALGMVAYDQWMTQSNQSTGFSSISANYQQVNSDQKFDVTQKTSEVKDPAHSPVAMEIDSLDELQQALKQGNGGTLYLKRKQYEISGSNGLTVNGGEWVIRPIEGSTATLRLLESASVPLFVVAAGTLNLQNLKLELNDAASTGIVTHDGAQVGIQQCELLRQPGGVSSLLRPNSSHGTFIRMTGGRSNSNPATVEVEGSIWHPSNGIGVTLETPGYIHVHDSWVAPQHQLLYLPAMGQVAQKRLAVLRHCSVAMGQDACFRISGSSPVRLELDQCVFSKLTGTSGTFGDDAALIVQDSGAQIDLQSSDLILHRIPTYCMLQREGGAREAQAKDWMHLRNVLSRFRDEGSMVVSRSPWVESRPWQRYQESRKLTALALKSDYAHIGPETLLGQTVRNSAVATRDQTETVNKTGSRTLVVDGRGEEPGTFTTINSALGSVTDEEETTILVQLQGMVSVKPTEVGNSRIIIRAAEGYRPELTLHRDTVAGPDGEAHLFRIHDGELTLDNVRLRLEGLRDPAKALTLMVVTGAGKCRLKDAVVTLKGNSEFTASVCMVGDPTGMMSPSNKPVKMGVARIECIDSIIRGNGQILFVQTSRPFSAQMQQSGVALDGVLFTIDGNRSDMTMPGETAQLQLDRCTCYSTRGILQLRASTNMPQLLALRCQPTQTILAVSEGQPMVRVDVQQSDSELKRKLIWQGKRNCYGGTGTYLSFQQLDQNAMATQYDASLWSELWGGDDEQAQMIKTLPITGLMRQTALAEWEANEFVLRMDGNSPMSIRDIGLPVEAMPRGSGQTP